MSPDKSRLADAIASGDLDRMARAIEEVTAEVHVLWQTIDAFHDDLVHVLRNPPEEWKMKREEAKDKIPESVSCDTCDAGCDSLAEAIGKGWIDLCRDDGLSWNYLGKCRTCQEAEAEQEFRDRTAEAQRAKDEPTETKANQETLF
jgi:hypothetical protein